MYRMNLYNFNSPSLSSFAILRKNLIVLSLKKACIIMFAFFLLNIMVMYDLYQKVKRMQ